MFLQEKEKVLGVKQTSFVFTKHAIERMKKRWIPKPVVFAILFSGKKEKAKAGAVKCRLLNHVVVIDGNRIITVYVKKERALNMARKRLTAKEKHDRKLRKRRKKERELAKKRKILFRKFQESPAEKKDRLEFWRGYEEEIKRSILHRKFKP